jgi:hypothetical protein
VPIPLRIRVIIENTGIYRFTVGYKGVYRKGLPYYTMSLAIAVILAIVAGAVGFHAAKRT